MNLETLATAGALAALIVGALGGGFKWWQSRRTLDFDVRGPLPLATTSNERFRWILEEDKVHGGPSESEIVERIYVQRIIAKNTGRKPVDAGNLVGPLVIPAPGLSGFVSGRAYSPSNDLDLTFAGSAVGRGYNSASLDFPTLIPGEELVIDLATRGWGVPGRVRPIWRTRDLSRQPRHRIIDVHLNSTTRWFAILGLVSITLLLQLLVDRQFAPSINLALLVSGAGAQLLFAYSVVRNRG